ncbi:hypothetical protein D3C80_1493270 [compost metagenome]
MRCRVLTNVTANEPTQRKLVGLLTSVAVPKLGTSSCSKSSISNTTPVSALRRSRIAWVLVGMVRLSITKGSTDVRKKLLGLSRVKVYSSNLGSSGRSCALEVERFVPIVTLVTKPPRDTSDSNEQLVGSKFRYVRSEIIVTKPSHGSMLR